MILLPLVALLLSAAPEPLPVSFEAASVKLATAGMTGYEGTSRSKVEYSPSRLTMSNVDLNDCVRWAYGIREDQISGGNDLGGERYEVLAKSAEHSRQRLGGMAWRRPIGRPVLDRTGIEGFYDFTLRGAATAVRENDGSLFGLVEDQLGLRVVSAKAAVEVFVIEHAEKPGAE